MDWRRGQEADAGFTARELNHLGPLSLVTSRDFFALDERRLDSYRRAGVSSSLLDALHAQAGEQIHGAETSLKSDDAAGLLRNATGAWADEARVYDAAQDLARDVVRGAIFMLLLFVPFSFCLERLAIGTPNVYRQIAGVVVIFAVMTLCLWTFHPAFKISGSPLIIILAFAIMFMSGAVLWVIYGKFDVELKGLGAARGAGASAGANRVSGGVARAGVMMSAVLLGLANMRRRKFRTALTSITIVLITFAVLCFTSMTRYVGTTTIPIGVASAHPGLMLRQRGFRPIPDAAADQLRAILRDPKLGASDATVAERWWGVSSVDPREQYELTATIAPPGQRPRTVAVQALLGLTPGESRTSAVADLLGVDAFARLEKGQTNIVYLPHDVADRLNVRAGGHIRLGGIDLEVASVFDADAFDKNALALSGDSIAPLRYGNLAVDAGGQRLGDTSVESLELGAGASAAEAGASYEHLSGSQIAIVPAALCRRLNNCTLRALAVRLRDETQVKAVSDVLARRFALPLFAGYDDGVRMVAASNLASVGGVGEVAVPLLIAALIIFNTMLGSIAERKGEIHVYTSLGLAPTHVGVLFVAEAMTYGLIGVVAGYVIGQGAGTAMLKLGWLGGNTLNYSGSAAVVSMGLILGVVLLSALVPARMASRLAAPSIERTWHVPRPVDGRIDVTLPFTINRTAADGVLAYLAEYFAAHREGTIGRFSADHIEAFVATGDAERSTERALRATVWLTPFDLGVRQDLTLRIHPGKYPDIYEVDVELRRLSGDDMSWYRQNRPFLTELRQQFLQWRSLSPARMMDYVHRSGQLRRKRIEPPRSRDAT